MKNIGKHLQFSLAIQMNSRQSFLTTVSTLGTITMTHEDSSYLNKYIGTSIFHLMLQVTLILISMFNVY